MDQEFAHTAGIGYVERMEALPKPVQDPLLIRSAVSPDQASVGDGIAHSDESRGPRGDPEPADFRDHRRSFQMA